MTLLRALCPTCLARLYEQRIRRLARLPIEAAAEEARALR